MCFPAPCPWQPDVREKTSPNSFPAIQEVISIIYIFYLDNSDHPWSLIDLHASFDVSDARVLNVSANRTELVATKAVKYEVRGLMLGQCH